jgi:hypothetical protein
MVNNVGQWTYVPNTPESEKCDLDLVAEWILTQGYSVKTSLENLTEMVVLHYKTELENSMCEFYEVDGNPCPLMINVQDVAAYVSASGGLSEFDYEV